jgi:hypothetical protein
LKCPGGHATEVSELDSTFPEVHRYNRAEIAVWLISRFGPEVNLANVEARPDEVLNLELLRRGIDGFGTYGRVGIYSVTGTG